MIEDIAQRRSNFEPLLPHSFEGFFQRIFSNRNPFYNTYDYDGFEWVSREYGLKHYKISAVRDCLSKVDLTFVGESHARYYWVYYLLSTEYTFHLTFTLYYSAYSNQSILNFPLFKILSCVCTLHIIPISEIHMYHKPPLILASFFIL